MILKEIIRILVYQLIAGKDLDSGMLTVKEFFDREEFFTSNNIFVFSIYSEQGSPRIVFYNETGKTLDLDLSLRNEIFDLIDSVFRDNSINKEITDNRNFTWGIHF